MALKGPQYFCTECGKQRYKCVCKPKCEYHLSDDVAKKVQEGLVAQIEQLCREVRKMGWGYRLAVQTKRREPEENRPVVYVLRHCILIPGQEPPRGKWTIYSPWLDKDD